ncbi:YafY family protein [uncultured Agrococcus sp.]|uniref:helix-turn-helix transcriptional regulator n=1 Tax=uncultured Agrococcus sp. TaxID=382258 RepID=UPI0025E6F159|nr:YafY family protein [uncultured Agrococcus sp.]
MRADRMISALLLMQARGRVTAKELAAELEISVATARRDLEALSMAGIPVYPQQGRGGGWSLIGGARTDLSGLTAQESQALFAMLGAAEGASSEISSAVRKLLRALPGPFRDDAAAAAAAVRVERAGWGESSAEEPPHVQTMRQAIVDRVNVGMAYTDSAGRRSERTISPLGLVNKGDRWYLVGVRPGEEPRTFRMDRVASVTVTDEPAEWPTDFDLDAHWRRFAERIEARRSLVRATVRLPSRYLWVLRDHFGAYLEVREEYGDVVEISVAAHTARSIAEQLAGWGATIDVLEPAEVRAELAQIGTELAEAYRG